MWSEAVVVIQVKRRTTSLSCVTRFIYAPLGPVPLAIRCGPTLPRVLPPLDSALRRGQCAHLHMAKTFAVTNEREKT